MADFRPWWEVAEEDEPRPDPPPGHEVVIRCECCGHYYKWLEGMWVLTQHAPLMRGFRPHRRPRRVRR
jgi:hypothetical protein